MNCEETQKHLSAYLDGRLDEAHRRAVESHLASCSHCRADVAALRRTIESVSALPPVEPPPGFSQRVMAQVREEARRPSPRQSFFFPLWARIPLQTAAVLLIAGLAVYLYELNQPAPVLHGPAQAPSPPPSREEGFRTDRDRQSVSPEAVLPAPAKTLPSQESERPVPAGSAAPADILKQSAAPSGVNAAASPALKEKKILSEADREVALIAQAPFNDRDRFMTELSAIVRQVDGAILTPEKETAAAGKLERQKPPEPYTVWLAIPPDRYPELRGKLASLGTIDSASPDAVARAMKPAEPSVSSAAPTTPPQLRIKLTVHQAPPPTP